MSMFSKPKTIVPAPKKALEKKKQEVEIAGLEQLAMVDALQKTLETVRGTLEAEIKSTAAERFASHIQATGQRPDNITGIEGNAAASIQFRRRSSAYGLSDEAVTLLRQHGIEPEKQVTAPELFAINPAYAGDQALLMKVEKALMKIVPEDFIVKQEEQCKLTASDATLNEAISKRCPAEVFQALTTISCGLKLQKTDMNSILQFVGQLIDAPTFGEAPPKSAAQPKRLRAVA